MLIKKILSALSLGLLFAIGGLLGLGVHDSAVSQANHIPAQAQPALDLGHSPALTNTHVITLSASKDNTLHEDPTGMISNGSGPFFFVGRIRIPTNSIRRGVLAFDVAGQVPAGATILSATLHLNMAKSQAGNQTVGLHPLLADWGEGTSSATTGQGNTSTSNDATWIHTFYDTQMWTTPGGDFSPTAVATASVGGPGNYVWNTNAPLVGNVQSWLDQPANNFGWLLMGNEADPQTVKQFASRENTTASLRPQLVVTYQGGSMAGLSITKEAVLPAGSAQLPPTGLVTYTITLSNSTDQSALGVLMTDTLPNEVSFEAWVNQGSAMLPGGNTITWAGDIGAQDTVQIQFTARLGLGSAMPGQTVVNTALFSSNNAGSGSASAGFTAAGGTMHQVFLPVVLK